MDKLCLPWRDKYPNIPQSLNNSSYGAIDSTPGPPEKASVSNCLVALLKVSLGFLKIKYESKSEKVSCSRNCFISPIDPFL